MRKKSIHCVNIVLNDELEILCSLAYVNCVHNEKYQRRRLGDDENHIWKHQITARRQRHLQNLRLPAPAP